MIRVILEEFAGEHSDLMHAENPPWCICGGHAVDGGDSCLYCGRYLHGLFNPVVSARDMEFYFWERFVRERPYADSVAA